MNVDYRVYLTPLENKAIPVLKCFFVRNIYMQAPNITSSMALIAVNNV